MKQQIGNDLSTIRPPLSNLEAPLFPNSVERSGNALSTIQTPRYAIDPAPSPEERQHITSDVHITFDNRMPIEPAPSPEERQYITNVLQTNRSPPTVNILNFSEVEREPRHISESTLIEHITFDTQMPATSPNPTLWGTIEHASSSIRHNSRKKTRKFTEKAPDSPMPFNVGIPIPHEPKGSGNIIRYHRVLNEWLNPFSRQQRLDLRVRLPPTSKCIDVNLQ
jgi:hypothetical protein